MKTKARNSPPQEDLKQVGLQFKEKLIEVGYEAKSASAIAAKAFPEIGSSQNTLGKNKSLSKRK